MNRFPPRPGRRARALFDKLRTWASRALDNDSLRLEGHVYVQHGGQEIYLGRNIITNRMSLNVAGLIAAKTLHLPAVYIGDQGYNESDAVYPLELYIGSGTTPATKDDLALASPILTPSPGLAPVSYPLDSILYYQTKASYGTDPIAVSFFFNIPAGESYDDGAGGSTNNIVIREWGMRDGAGQLVTRKVATIDKLSELDLRVRWEIRT